MTGNSLSDHSESMMVYNKLVYMQNDVQEVIRVPQLGMQPCEGDIKPWPDATHPHIDLLAIYLQLLGPAAFSYQQPLLPLIFLWRRCRCL